MLTLACFLHSAVYVNDHQVVVNSGVQLTSCGTVDLSPNRHPVLVKYIHTGSFATASVSYRIKRSEQEEPLPLLPLDSISPGWCSGTFDTRTSCFGAPATDQCDIRYPLETAGGDVVRQWNFSITLKSPLQVLGYSYIHMHIHGYCIWLFTYIHRHK